MYFYKVKKKTALGFGLADANNYIQMDKQGPAVQHKELYSIACEKLPWKRI